MLISIYFSSKKIWWFWRYKKCVKCRIWLWFFSQITHSSALIQGWIESLLYVDRFNWCYFPSSFCIVFMQLFNPNLFVGLKNFISIDQNYQTIVESFLQATSCLIRRSLGHMQKNFCLYFGLFCGKRFLKWVKTQNSGLQRGSRMSRGQLGRSSERTTVKFLRQVFLGTYWIAFPRDTRSRANFWSATSSIICPKMVRDSGKSRDSSINH